MSMAVSKKAVDLDHQSDETLVAFARTGSEAAVRSLVKRYNQRLFRVARSVVRNDAEAEDVVQASYVKAFTHLDGFRGDARFSTWITRIALNDALERQRRLRSTTDVESIDAVAFASGSSMARPPLSIVPLAAETEVMRMEIAKLLEEAIGQLPELFRVVFVLRDVQDMSVEETADLLDIKPQTVKTRLHRARLQLRTILEERFIGGFADVFPFDGDRCVGMADRVIADLRRAGRPVT
jgi:RNA polymerase sigma-70 factor (ECF subfamily)